MRRSRTESAFTLIELLVVMIIISILMAIAVPTFLSQKSTARRTQLLENLHNIQVAIESCASGNTDGSYAGCTEHTFVQAYEASLKDLPICCPNGTRVAGEFDINGVEADDSIVWVPTPTQAVQGYEIDTWMKDGDKDIWFQVAHWADGTVTKKCGLGKRPTFTKAAEAGVPGSRACPTGSWG
jgi:prepilin-type N-terminal cleavage/methylation domain-containing protein